MRAGGDRRGSNVARRRRKIWMLATFDVDLGPDKARCHLRLSERCRDVLTFDTITADRKDPGGTYRHENVQPACRPCQHTQGALITNERRRQWIAWMEEARAEGIEWDGVI